MEKLKKNILIYLVVWIILAILLVAPVTYTITDGGLNGLNWMQSITANLMDNIFKFPISHVFEDAYIKDFITGMEYYSIAYFAIMFYAIYKTLPKSAYDNIEHGSSDWCVPGEQYRILSKKSGIILARDNYLPIDKTGNVNVLIVGRIW